MMKGSEEVHILRAVVFSLVTFAMCAGACAAQNESDPWGVNAWYERHQHRFHVHDWDEAPDPAQALERIHEDLRRGNDHDAYLALISSGTKESVPILLERLRLACGETEPQPLPGHRVAYPCTVPNLLEALTTITNTDQGAYYPKWKQWWDANRELSQHQWKMNGFLAAGLHAVEPVDERFALELIGWMAEREQYKSINARRELAEAPAPVRSRGIAIAAAQSPTMKLGALAAIRDIDTAGQEDVLRQLAHDPDGEIRVLAIGELNDRLRLSRVASNAGIRLLRGPSESGHGDEIAFVGEKMLVASFGGNVQAFDVRTGKVLWKRPGSASIVMAADDCIVLATGDSRGNELTAINFRGQELWRKAVSNVRLFSIQGAELFAVHETENDQPGRIDRIALATGKLIGSVTTPAVNGNISDFDGASDLAFYTDQAGVHSLTGSSSPGIQPAAALSVTNRYVCVNSRGTKPMDDHSVTCLDPYTLVPTWSRLTALTGTWGHGVAPVQTEHHVFVPTDRALFAFRAADGFLEWATPSGQEDFGNILATDYGLLIMSSKYDVELRDYNTGEVVLNWPQLPWVASGEFAVSKNYLAVTGSSGELWLIDLDKSGAPLVGKD